MQDKDTETLRNQRRRRKRIGRMKSAIVITIAGWMILSMILIIFLFARTVSLEKKLDNLILISRGEGGTEYQLNGHPVSAESLVPEDATEQKDEDTVRAPAPASGIDEAENRAAAGDVHRVYLTFDDGPSENTAEILDILAEYDVKATFFVTGREDEESKALYQRIAEEGHTLGMHSYSNKYSVIYQSKDAFVSDYRRLKEYLYDLTGEECRYYRFPGGSSNQISNVPMDELISFLNEEGTVYFDWNVSAGDAASLAYSPDEIVENVTEDVVKYKTSVVLLHDAEDKKATAEALGTLIGALKDMGAEILPIDEDTPVIQYVKADSAE